MKTVEQPCDSKMVPCNACKTLLRLMHIDQQANNDTLTVNKLYHCESCHRDWEIEEIYTLKSRCTKRKFWG